MIHRRVGRLLVVGAIVLAAVVGPSATGSAEARRKPYPMDVTITSTPSRTVAASGQSIRFSGGDCAPEAHAVVVELHAGADADFENEYPVAASEAQAKPDRTFAVDLVLLDRQGQGQNGLLPEGDYTAVTWCHDGNGYVRSEAVGITIDGAMPSTDIEVTTYAYLGAFDLVGGSCVGQTVSLSIRGAGDETPGDEQSVDTTVTPEADGTWSYHWQGPNLGALIIMASCGDPLADGFRYSLQVAPIVYAPDGVPTDSVIDTTTTSTTTTTTTTTAAATTPTSPATASAATPVAGTAAYTG
ncbi:MAG: hypothetical protein ACTHN0_14215 [Aquihabitans sp.]